MKKIMVSLSAAALLVGCSGLSREAKEIVGVYYNHQVSTEIPVLELNGSGRCVVRNIAPGVLTMEVGGRWNVDNDSLVIIPDLSTLKLDGDTSIAGEIAPRITRRVNDHDDRSLILSKDNIEYMYLRHFDTQ